MKDLKQLFRVFIFGFILAFMMQLFTMCPTDNPTNPIVDPPAEETAQMKAFTNHVVSAFQSGDKQQVIDLMYDEYKEVYSNELTISNEKMSQFASALENRKIIFSNELLAEYEINIDGTTFTISYSNTGDGIWKLNRF
jgi:hypothetical protein